MKLGDPQEEYVCSIADSLNGFGSRRRPLACVRCLRQPAGTTCTILPAPDAERALFFYA